MISRHWPPPLALSQDDLLRCHCIVGPTTWAKLSNRRILITGGTGFIGKWLLAVLLDANIAFKLNCSITVLSRDPEQFQSLWPVEAASVHWTTGDVRELVAGCDQFDIILHAATDVALNTTPNDQFATCVEGTRRVIEFALNTGASDLLFVSSGAVYGPLDQKMTNVDETYPGGPDPIAPHSAYGEGKRAAEWLVANSGGSIRTKIARVFTLIGPHMPLHSHFAAGNFMRAALAGEEIVIHGDGTARRSYMYTSDMAAWLWTILLRGEPNRPYNVGSEESISIVELASNICELVGRVPIRILNSKQELHRASQYVPNVSRALNELKLPAPLSIREAILRTAKWYRGHN